LSDVLLTAFDARRRLLTQLGEGGLILAGDDDRDMHRLQEFAERNHVPYRTVLRSDPSAWSEVAATSSLPETGSAVVAGRGRVLAQPTTRELAAAVGLDLSGLPDRAICDLLIVGAGPAGLASAGRPARLRGSRTTSASRAGSPAANWPGRRCCRQSSSGHSWLPRGG
jgi:thioredoxin reductase (NADPH)